jgi:hypothetical protein
MTPLKLNSRAIASMRVSSAVSGVAAKAGADDHGGGAGGDQQRTAGRDDHGGLREDRLDLPSRDRSDPVNSR